MRSKWILAALVVLVGGALYAGTVLASSQATTTSLADKIAFGEIDINDHAVPADTWQARLKTQGDSDGYIVDNVIPAHSTTGWHTHPGPSLIFVIRGAVTNVTGDATSCNETTYAAGTGFVDEGGGDVHMLRNDGDVDAETIAVQLLPKGAERKTPEPAPAGCAQ